jgi:hypothetical protein
MPRYPKQPLEDKLAWMRERQRVKTEEEERRKGELPEGQRRSETVRQPGPTSPKYTPRCARPGEEAGTVPYW